MGKKNLGSLKGANIRKLKLKMQKFFALFRREDVHVAVKIVKTTVQIVGLFYSFGIFG